MAASPFTQIERDIVSRVASGQSAREIAAAVLLSERAVARHIEVCKQKLGVKKNSALVARAIEGRLCD